MPLFVHYDAMPLTWYQFSAMLKKALSFAQVPQGLRYLNHGFRIGCASQMAINAVPDDEIKQIDRLSSKSIVYNRYIRIPCSQMICH